MAWRRNGGTTLTYHRSNSPTPHRSNPPVSSAPRLDLDHIVRSGLAHARGADADVSGLLSQLSQVRRSQVTHSRLDAADQLREDPVGRRGNLFQGFDPFRRDLLRAVGRLAVTRRRAG